MKSSPFKDCKNLNEVVEVIRAKCESLRGKRYRRFEVDAVYHIAANRLRFTIAADRTESPVDNIDWYELITGKRYSYFPTGSKLHRYRGDLFKDYLRNHGKDVLWSHSVSISLTHIPHIRKMYLRNVRRDQKAHQARHRQYPYTRAELDVLRIHQSLICEIAAWRSMNYDNYIAKHPMINLRTGKPNT